MSPNTITIGKPALVRASWSHFDHAWELKEIIFRKNDNVFVFDTGYGGQGASKLLHTTVRHTHSHGMGKPRVLHQEHEE